MLLSHFVYNGKQSDETTNKILEDFLSEMFLQNKPGPRNEARNVTDPLTAFSLFLPDDLLETVVTHTNNRISFFHDKFPNLRDARAKLVDLVEIKAYLGIMYLHAALKQNLRDSQSI